MRQAGDQITVPICPRHEFPRPNLWRIIFCALQKRHFANDLGWAGGPGYYLIRKRDTILGLQFERQFGVPSSAELSVARGNLI
jgi:hypothetical protein